MDETTPVDENALGLYELTNLDTFETVSGSKRWWIAKFADKLNAERESTGNTYRWILIGTFEQLAWGNYGNNQQESSK